MGYVFFWLEAAVTSLLFVIMAATWIAPRRGGGRHIGLWIAVLFLAMLPWVVAIAGFSLVYAFVRLGLFQLVTSSVSLGLAMLVGLAVARRGRRRMPPTADAPEGLPVHTTWRPRQVALAFIVALILTTITYWNLAISARQEMDEVRAQAIATLQAAWPAPVTASMSAEPLYRQAYEMLDAQDTAKSKWAATTGELLDQYIKPSVHFQAPPAPGSPLLMEGPKPPATQPIAPLLSKAAPALALVRRAAAMPEYSANVDYNIWRKQLPRLNRYLDLSKLLALEALQASGDGHVDRAMDEITDAFRMPDHVSQSPLLIGNLISGRLDGIAVWTLERVLAKAPPTADSLAHLHIVVNSGALPSFQRAMRCEFARSTVEACSPRGLLSDWLNPDGWVDLLGRSTEEREWERQYTHVIVVVLTALERPLCTFFWNDDQKATDWYPQAYLEALDLPYAAWKEKSESIDAALGQGPGLLGKGLMANFSRAYVIMLQCEARHRLAYLAKPMWLYRLKNGHFPESLELLVPDFLPVLPKDPFTGKDLLIGHTAEGKTFLYSVGPDMKDDRGEDLGTKRGYERGDITFYLEGGRPMPASFPASQPAKK